MVMALPIHAQTELSMNMMFTSEVEIVTSSEVQILTSTSRFPISSITTSVVVMSSMSPTMPTPAATTQAPTPTTPRNPCQGVTVCGATAICQNQTVGSSFYCQCRQGYYISNESNPIEDNQSGTNCLGKYAIEFIIIKLQVCLLGIEPTK